MKSLKDLTNRAVLFHWLLPGHLPLTKLTFYCAILCCIFKRHHLFDTGLVQTKLTDVLWLKWINSRINIGEIWVLQWSTKSHRCFQCCLVIWAWAVTTQSFIIQMKDGEQAVETQRSYQAPSVRRWNKWCRACSPPHTDTSRHLRGLARRWREHRSLFALGPVDTNTNNRSKMVAMRLLGHCGVAWFHGCLQAQVKRDYCQFSLIFWSQDMGPSFKAGLL